MTCFLLELIYAITNDAAVVVGKGWLGSISSSLADDMCRQPGTWFVVFLASNLHWKKQYLHRWRSRWRQCLVCGLWKYLSNSPATSDIKMMVRSHKQFLKKINITVVTNSLIVQLYKRFLSNFGVLLEVNGAVLTIEYKAIRNFHYINYINSIFYVV